MYDSRANRCRNRKGRFTPCPPSASKQVFRRSYKPATVGSVAAPCANQLLRLNNGSQYCRGSNGRYYLKFPNGQTRFVSETRVKRAVGGAVAARARAAARRAMQSMAQPMTRPSVTPLEMRVSPGLCAGPTGIITKDGKGEVCITQTGRPYIRRKGQRNRFISMSEFRQIKAAWDKVVARNMARGKTVRKGSGGFSSLLPSVPTPASWDAPEPPPKRGVQLRLFG